MSRLTGPVMDVIVVVTATVCLTCMTWSMTVLDRPPAVRRMTPSARWRACWGGRRHRPAPSRVSETVLDVERGARHPRTRTWFAVGHAAPRAL